MKTCERCGASFEPKPRQPHQRFCSPSCRRRFNDAQRKATPEIRAETALAEKLGRKQAAYDSQAALLRARVSEIKLLKEELEQTQHALSLYTRDYVVRPEWLSVRKNSKVHRGTLIAILSDVHAGEVVDADEMNGYNAYNLEIADARLRRFFDRTMVVSRDFLAGVKYDGIILALGGDLVSGDIHDELEQTNECSTYEAVEFLAPRIVAGIEKLAEEFGRVHVVSAPGNHGRDSKRPRHKRRSPHNADTHTAQVVKMLMDARGASTDVVTFNVPRSFDVAFDAYGYTFNLEHGDALRFNGTSEIGALGPAKRGTLRKSNQMLGEGSPFNYSLIGHFHQYVPAAPQGFVMNGSLKGYDEYARSWHLKPEPAQQALMVVTPEHGITVQTPVLAQKRSAEGW